jgi:hypothetical protein
MSRRKKGSSSSGAGGGDEDEESGPSKGKGSKSSHNDMRNDRQDLVRVGSWLTSADFPMDSGR